MRLMALRFRLGGGWRVIRVTQADATEYVRIDNVDLDKALAPDAGAEETSAALQARLECGNRKANVRAVLRKN